MEKHEKAKNENGLCSQSEKCPVDIYIYIPWLELEPDRFRLNRQDHHGKYVAFPEWTIGFTKANSVGLVRKSKINYDGIQGRLRGMTSNFIPSKASCGVTQTLLTADHSGLTSHSTMIRTSVLGFGPKFKWSKD